LIPKVMLTATAITEPRTPAAPLIPQNHGAGFGLCFITIRIPVGKPKPINNPAGAMIATAVAARARMELLSMEASRPESHIGKMVM